MTFAIESEREEDGRWMAEIPWLPGVLADGDTEEEVRARVQALALRVVADRLELGEEGPEPVERGALAPPLPGDLTTPSRGALPADRGPFPAQTGGELALPLPAVTREDATITHMTRPTRAAGFWAATLATFFSLSYVVAQLAEWAGWLGSAGGPESASTPLGMVVLLTPPIPWPSPSSSCS